MTGQVDLLRCMRPFVARMRPAGRADQCPQLEVERTQRGRRLWAVHEPERTPITGQGVTCSVAMTSRAEWRRRAIQNR